MEVPPAVTLWASADLGSNTFRLLVAEEVRPGVVRPAELRQRVVRLAEGLRPGGAIQPRARARAEALLGEFRRHLDARGVEHRVGFLAAAGRNAVDGQEFAARAGEILGGPVRIVSGGEEARLSLRGALGLLARPASRVLFLDIGGGSTEVAAWEGDAPTGGVSLPVGVVGLWEARTWADPPGPGDLGAARAACRAAWERLGPAFDPCRWADDLGSGRAEVVATAGTPLTVAAQVTGRPVSQTRGLSGVWVERRGFDEVFRAFRTCRRADRARLPSVEPGREDVILPGLVLLETFLDRFSAPGFRVSDGGLLEGGLLHAVEQARGAARLEPYAALQQTPCPPELWRGS
ncbi:Ppx/GppA phosphatase family protein [Deferrisoma camini]|uniref:Ppx/GppA phosphatase family protein n=1 Tax=Deferrisoma camini TaxID=1035120 RepID=UPI00046CA325|nr:hypothetical protein [Deferrisoma camini]